MPVWVASGWLLFSNLVAAVVWNDGRQKPDAQISFLTGFILQGNTPAEEILNTNESWKTAKDESYQPLPVRVPGYYVAGPSEFVDMRKHLKGWERNAFNDSNWVNAPMIGAGTTKATAINSTGWMLVPSPLPPMEMTRLRLSSTREAEGVEVPMSFPATPTKVTIPANTRATILLDQGTLMNAYPTLLFAVGRRLPCRWGMPKPSTDREWPAPGPLVRLHWAKATATK